MEDLNRFRSSGNVKILNEVLVSSSRCLTFGTVNSSTSRGDGYGLGTIDCINVKLHEMSCVNDYGLS